MLYTFNVGMPDVPLEIANARPTLTGQLSINGVVAHGLTLSRNEPKFHLPTESGGGFSEAGHSERGV